MLCAIRRDLREATPDRFHASDFSQHNILLLSPRSKGTHSKKIWETWVRSSDLLSTHEHPCICVCACVHTKSVYRGHRDLPFLIILMALFDFSKNMVPSLLVRSGEGRVGGSEHSYPLTPLVSFMPQICGILYYARAIAHPSTP